MLTTVPAGLDQLTIYLGTGKGEGIDTAKDTTVQTEG
jgi:hypothetical protein